LSYAAQTGNIQYLKFVHSKILKQDKEYSVGKFFSLSDATRGNSLECLVYTHKILKARDTDDLCLTYAVRHANIECLIYAHEVIHLDTIKNFEYVGQAENEYVMEAAARSGSITCMIYAHEKIHASDEWQNVLEEAIYSKNIDCVRYAHKIRKKDYFHSELIAASEVGNIQILKYIYENYLFCPSRRYNMANILENTARSGSLECLKYANEVIRARPNNNLLKNAKKSKNIECINYTQEIIKGHNNFKCLMENIA
jgi:hypothetical protein